MPATGGSAPTLSQVRGWDTAHLTEAAEHWTRTATVWEDNFSELAARINRPGGTTWDGQAAEAAQQRTYTDRMTVIGLADELHAASGIARTGATAISEARRLALGVVDAAEAAGFTVGEDFSVTDPRVYDAATAAIRQAQAEAIAADLRSTVGALVAADAGVAAQLTAATAGLGAEVFPESGEPENGSAVKAVGLDMPLSPADPKPKPPDPVDKLGLPDYHPGTLSDAETRTVYAQGELRMRELNEEMIRQGMSAEDRAKVMFDQRNALRTWVRDLMSDRALADQLNAKEANLTWEQLQAKLQGRGLSGDELYNAVVDSSTRSRASVNEALGIDPEHPPALPPVHPAAPPVAPPATAPVISAPPDLSSLGKHSPTAIPPAVAAHPPATAPAPVVLDHPPLPPWLQNPALPGFQVTPSQPPAIFGWDQPDPPPAVAPMPAPSGPVISFPHPPPITPQDAGNVGILTGVGAAGLWVLTQLGKLAHPFGP